MTNLPVSPGRPCSPPQNGEDREKRPPQGVGRLVCDDRENDADNNANQRHEIAYANRYVVFAPLSTPKVSCYQGGDEMLKGIRRPAPRFNWVMPFPSRKVSDHER
jgi:hypothetical protein